MAERSLRVHVVGWVAAGLVVTVGVLFTGTHVGVAWAENDYLSHLDAARAGFEVTYLMEVITRPLLDRWTEKLPRNAALAVRPNSDLGAFYEARGWLRQDIRADPTGPFVLVVWRSRGAGFTEDLWSATRLRDSTIDGVPVASLFFKPPKLPAP